MKAKTVYFSFSKAAPDEVTQGHLLALYNDTEGAAIRLQIHPKLAVLLRTCMRATTSMKTSELIAQADRIGFDFSSLDTHELSRFLNLWNFATSENFRKLCNAQRQDKNSAWPQRGGRLRFVDSSSTVLTLKKGRGCSVCGRPALQGDSVCFAHAK